MGGRAPRRVRQRVGARGRQAGAQGEPQHQAGAAPRPPGAHQQVRTAPPAARGGATLQREIYVLTIRHFIQL